MNDEERIAIKTASYHDNRHAYREFLLGNRAERALYDGKTVLDLGCGMPWRARAVRDAGIPSTVISLDHRWLNLSIGRRLPGRVLAEASALPFSEATFDLVFSRGAPPCLVWTAEECEAQFAELLRVLKPDGFAIIQALLGFIDRECTDQWLSEGSSRKSGYRFNDPNNRREILERSNAWVQERFSAEYIRVFQPHAPRCLSWNFGVWILRK
ncbi:MAG: class I SAM-dependent methyltransferase [Patescibacteria group bacterium]|jgi:ubiquinone/menaquinone biosynthesis C-methylase UbiE